MFASMLTRDGQEETFAAIRKALASIRINPVDAGEDLLRILRLNIDDQGGSRKKNDRMKNGFPMLILALPPNWP